MKKLSFLLFVLCLAPMVFGDVIGTTDQVEPASTFRVHKANSVPYNGPRAPAILVDTLRLNVLNPVGYCWGIAYDWDRDALWVTQWNSAYNKMYCIQKTSPTTKIDSVILGSGVPTYRLGIGYVGSNTMRMAGYNNTIYTINMTTGVGTTYRTLPWSASEGLDANVVDDAIYAADWSVDQCAWAKPAASGSWTTWAISTLNPSGFTGAASGTASPAKLFMVDEVTSGQAHIFQYTHTAGVPNTTPESIWTMDAGMTQASTADAAFDGQYVYVIDQNGADGRIWVYDVGIGSVPDSHEVATTAIVNPGQYVDPGAATQPQATFRNGGLSSETFNTCFRIDSAGTNVYNQTINLTLAAGEDSTLTYASWTPAAGTGVVYNLTAYNDFVDPNMGNDTLHATTTTQAAYWKIYTSSVPAAVYYNSCAYAEPNGNQKVYSLANYTTAAVTTIYEFDCATETWSTSSAVLNHGVARAAAATVNGKIYVMGGSSDLSTGLNYCQEFDPVAGTVTDRATMPTASQFLTAAAWRDSLVYVLGGQSGTTYYNLVQIYNPATNSWSSGTAMPTTNRSFTMGISGDTIFFTGGYNGAYLATSYIGVINPSNPTQITWTAGPNIPTGGSGTAGRSRLQGAFVLGKFYFTGGDDHGVAAYDTWFWDPADNLWHQTLDKPTPISNSAAAVYVPFLDGGVFLCSGGYNTAGGAGTNACEGLINLGNAVEEKPGSPKDLVTFGFAPNLPNPVKNRVSLVYATLAQGNVSLKVFDGAGRLVRDLSPGVQPAGTKTVVWDAKDNTGSDLQNGVYFVRLEANGRVAAHKLVLVK